MRQTVRKGVAIARPELAHSVHVLALGLDADRWYWYRFSALGEASPIGRTRTLPAPWHDPRRLRLAFISCQDSAGRLLSRALSPGRGGSRSRNPPRRLHLRVRAAARRPPAARCPGNHHAGGLSTPARPVQDRSFSAGGPCGVPDDRRLGRPRGREQLCRRPSRTGLRDPDPGGISRATGRRLPGFLRAPAAGVSHPDWWRRSLRLFRQFRFGRLAELSVLDTRQYRTDQPACPPLAEDVKLACPAAFDPAATPHRGDSGAVASAWPRDIRRALEHHRAAGDGRARGLRSRLGGPGRSAARAGRLEHGCLGRLCGGPEPAAAVCRGARRPQPGRAHR